MDAHQSVTSIIEAHIKLQNDLKNIKPYRSSDANAVARDRCMRVLMALMDYVANTPIPVDGTVHTIHSLICALHDVDNGQHNALLKPKKAKSSRPVNTSVHHRRAVVLVLVERLKRDGVARNETDALKCISEASTVKFETLKSALNKAKHEANLDVLDPNSYTIPDNYNLSGLATYIHKLFYP